MPAGTRTFVLKFLGDTKQLGGEFQKINGQMRNFEGSLTSTQKVAAGIGTSNMLANLGSGFTSKLTSGAKAASDLTEAMNKSRVVFGEHDTLIQAFGADSANTFGISKRAAHEYAGTLGQILRAGGLNQEAAAGMSVDLLKLASDMASFNNITIDESLEKIRAGLVGETEPLRTVGVLLSAAAVNEKALELGISDGTEALTEQQKVQARYAIILEQTTSAQGDFLRTQHEAANASRRVAAEGENAAAVVGGPTNEAFGLLRNTWLEIPPVGREIVNVSALLAGGLAVVAGVTPSVVSGFGLMASGATALAPLMIAALPFIAYAAAAAAIVAAGVLIYQNWDELSARAAGVRDAVLGTMGLDTGKPGGSAAQKGADAVGKGVLSAVPVWGQLSTIVGSIKTGQQKGILPGFKGKVDTGPAAIGGIPQFANGGVVPGPRGGARLVMAHGGETITPAGRAGVVVNVFVEGSVHSDADLQSAILGALRTAQQRGSLGFA